jgi:glutamate-ammonia-ligase adenylyltransferase
LVDVEFAAQYLQLIHAVAGGPLRTHTGEALAAMSGAGLADPTAIAALTEAWRLQQDLSQILKLAFEGDVDPAQEPKGFRDRLARAGGARARGARGFRALETRLIAVRAAAIQAFDALVPVPSA